MQSPARTTAAPALLAQAAAVTALQALQVQLLLHLPSLHLHQLHQLHQLCCRITGTPAGWSERSTRTSTGSMQRARHTSWAHS